MNRICIGITTLTPGWQSLLDQIGVWYEEVDANRTLSKYYSTIIVNTPPEGLFLNKLQPYLRKGGTLLITEAAKKIRFEYHRTEQNGPTLPFEFQDQIEFFTSGAGFCCQWKMNPDEQLANNDYSRQRFYFKTEKHPDELVSSIDKGSLSESVRVCLAELHIHRDLPFIRKWHSPTKKPIFAFRIDSDYSDKESVLALYEVGKEFKVPMTWFLHVEVHEDWLNVFKSFEGQEIALHGYEHFTSNSYETVLHNIEHGKQLMVHAGLHPNGFCVPYGIWNDTLAEVLETFHFRYSSEFTVAYDSDPFKPIHNQQQTSSYQIPIHPICTGSLHRKKATIDEMKSYFLKKLAQKTARFENVLFYHHPLQPGLELWPAVFRRVQEEAFTMLSFSEFTDFWERREKARFEPIYDSDKKELHCTSSDEKLMIQIAFKQNQFYLGEAKTCNQPLHTLTKHRYQPYTEYSESERAELTTDKLQLLKTSILDWKNRNRS